MGWGCQCYSPDGAMGCGVSMLCARGRYNGFGVPMLWARGRYSVFGVSIVCARVARGRYNGLGGVNVMRQRALQCVRGVNVMRQRALQWVGGVNVMRQRALQWVWGVSMLCAPGTVRVRKLQQPNIETSGHAVGPALI